MIATLIDAIGNGAFDAYVRFASLLIGPAIGAAVFAVAMIGAPR